MENLPPNNQGPNMNYPAIPEDTPRQTQAPHQPNQNPQMNPNMAPANGQIQGTLNFSAGPPQQGHPYAAQQPNQDMYNSQPPMYQHQVQPPRQETVTAAQAPNFQVAPQHPMQQPPMQQPPMQQPPMQQPPMQQPPMQQGGGYQQMPQGLGPQPQYHAQPQQGYQPIPNGQPPQGYQQMPQNQIPQGYAPPQGPPAQPGIQIPGITITTGQAQRPQPVVQERIVYVHYDTECFKTKCGFCGHNGTTRVVRNMDDTMCCLLVLCILFCWSIVGCICMCIICANINNYHYVHHCNGCGRELGRRSRD